MAGAGSAEPSHRTQLIRSLTVVAVLAMLLAAGLYVFRSLRDLPGDAVSGGREVLRDMRSVAQAFASGTVTTSFVSYATEIQGSSYFQFATLRQVEVFERSDSASVLWGNLQLPEVVVRATAPVETTYYLDLDDPWEFHRHGARILAVAPRIRFNKPAVDASEIDYEVRAGSYFRDEEASLQRLKRGLTRMSRERARENVPLVREMARQRTEAFVSTWLAQRFSDGGDYGVEVVFRDETPGGSVPVMEPPGDPASAPRSGGSGPP